MKVGARASVLVWDPLQRLLHWLLVAAVALAWWAGEARLSLHSGAGYVALGVACLRILLGWFGSRHARFTDFVRGGAAVWRYARAIARGEEPRCLGHNPLGGWMILALLGLMLVVCISGWLYTTDRFWGMAWLEQLHFFSAWTLVVLAGLHVAGVLFTSWRHRENLIAAMLTGRKRC